MLHYAYSRRMPVQIVHSSNKEKVISEKVMTLHLGVTVAVAHSEVIHPKDFKDFEAFFNKVQSTWDATWALVDSTDPTGMDGYMEFSLSQLCCLAHVLLLLCTTSCTGLKEFQPSPLRFDMPLPMRKTFLRYMIVMLGLFAAAAVLMTAGALWALVVLPPVARVAVPAALLAWFSASLWVVRRPIVRKKKTQ